MGEVSPGGWQQSMSPIAQGLEDRACDGGLWDCGPSIPQILQVSQRNGNLDILLNYLLYRNTEKSH